MQDDESGSTPGGQQCSPPPGYPDSNCAGQNYGGYQQPGNNPGFARPDYNQNPSYNSNIPVSNYYPDRPDPNYYPNNPGLNNYPDNPGLNYNPNGPGPDYSRYYTGPNQYSCQNDPQQGYYQNYYPMRNPGLTDHKDKALIGLILGLASFLGFLIPIAGVGCAIAGIVFSVIGRRSSRRGMALAGLVLSIIGLIASMIAWIVYAAIILIAL